MCTASVAFNLINGGSLGWFMGHVADYPDQWLTDPRFVVGLVLFIGGAALNIWADYRLRYLRSKDAGRRVMPSGGPFNVVCCPKLSGEIIEWVGFALLTWSLPGLAFALWTIANLVPRAQLVSREFQRLSEGPRGSVSGRPVGDATASRSPREFATRILLVEVAPQPGNKSSGSGIPEAIRAVKPLHGREVQSGLAAGPPLPGCGGWWCRSIPR